MAKAWAPSALAVCQRIVAAVVGGYALATAVSVCVSLALPVARADAALTGLLASFAVYAAVILWAFAARSLPRMWCTLGCTILGATALASLLLLAARS